MAVAIEKSDIRGRRREKKIGNFIVFVVDASGSMGAGKRMIATKGAILFPPYGCLSEKRPGGYGSL
ncbi:MAG: hypothetical protein AB1487_06640 [Thermodesulfobacteriota bacterium]